MNPSELVALHAVHVISVIALVGGTFYAFAAAPETRKRTLALTGIATLLVALTGIRMWQGMFGFAAMGWIFVKIACWLGLSAITGMAYRKRDKVRGLMWITLILAIVAVIMVYAKPF